MSAGPSNLWPQGNSTVQFPDLLVTAAEPAGIGGRRTVVQAETEAGSPYCGFEPDGAL